jgi:hypothetical protein
MFCNFQVSDCELRPTTPFETSKKKSGKVTPVWDIRYLQQNALFTIIHI